VVFDGWSLVSGPALLGDSAAQQTTVTPMGDCLVEAALSGVPTCFQAGFDAWGETQGLTPGTDGHYDPMQDATNEQAWSDVSLLRGGGEEWWVKSGCASHEVIQARLGLSRPGASPWAIHSTKVQVAPRRSVVDSESVSTSAW
jgi:hypothetical protein